MATKRTIGTPWKAGQSGNPKGRPAGQTKIAKWREALALDVTDILAALVAQAKAGDVMAARLILERALPALKPTEQAVALALPDGTLTEQGRAVLGAVAAGALAPGQGAQLISAIGQLAKVVETDELTKLAKALENQHGIVNQD